MRHDYMSASSTKLCYIHLFWQKMHSKLYIFWNCYHYRFGKRNFSLREERSFFCLKYNHFYNRPEHRLTWFLTWFSRLREKRRANRNTTKGGCCYVETEKTFPYKVFLRFFSKMKKEAQVSVGCYRITPLKSFERFPGRHLREGSFSENLQTVKRQA